MVFVGIDVSKDRLDVHVLPSGEAFAVTRDGKNVADCFDTIYYFERAAETYITALSTGRELNIDSKAVAEKTARQREEYPDFADKHLTAIRAVLDKEGADYAE
jgi:hypothetical protein